MDDRSAEERAKRVIVAPSSRAQAAALGSEISASA